MNRLFLWGPVVAMMLFIFAASSVPDLPAPPGGITDKVAHSLVYAVLAVLILRALTGGRMAGVTLRRALAALALTTLYGVTDEIHQSLVPGRTPELLDVLADARGAALGLLATLIVAALQRRRTPQADPR